MASSPTLFCTTAVSDEEVDSTADISDNESTTSSISHEHETFATFQTKVTDLLLHLFPDLQRESIKLERMGGGSFNRVIGVSIGYKSPRWLGRAFSFVSRYGRPKVSKQTEEVKYVLRIPWNDHIAWLEHEVAIITYLNQHTSLPVASISKFDLSYENSIGLRYTLQTRLPGKDAYEVYPNLNPAQRICFARQLGNALQEMGKKAFPYPGVLDPDSISKNVHHPTMVRFDVPSRTDASRCFERLPVEKECPSVVKVPLELVKDTVRRQIARDVSLHRLSGPWKRIQIIFEALDNLGFLDDNMYYLSHLDLGSRNVLIDVKSNDTAVLSGIIDWDSAVFAPGFMNCSPPQWLWQWEATIAQDIEPDEKHANNMPADLNNRDIKRAFEDAVGDRYSYYAYIPEYQIARGIFALLIKGVDSTDDDTKTTDLFKYWNALHPEFTVSLDPFEDFLAGRGGDQLDTPIPEEAQEEQAG